MVVQGDISRIESGTTTDPGIFKLKHLADALGVPIQEFWGGVPEPDDTFKEFLRSPFAEGITPEEIKELQRAVWVWGKPTVRSWCHALDLMRSTRGKK